MARCPDIHIYAFLPINYFLTTYEWRVRGTTTPGEETLACTASLEYLHIDCCSQHTIGWVTAVISVHAEKVIGKLTEPLWKNSTSIDVSCFSLLMHSSVFQTFNLIFLYVIPLITVWKTELNADILLCWRSITRADLVNLIWWCKISLQLADAYELFFCLVLETNISDQS